MTMREPADVGGLIVRLADKRDVAAIGDLWLELIAFHNTRDGRFRVPPGGRQTYIRHVHNALRDDAYRVLVAEAEGLVIGYILGYTAHNPPIFPEPHYGFIADLCVTDACRRRGAGVALVTAMRAWFRTRGLLHVQLNVAHCNATSQAFWRRMGCTDYLCQMWMPLDG